MMLAGLGGAIDVIWNFNAPFGGLSIRYPPCSFVRALNWAVPLVATSEPAFRATRVSPPGMICTLSETRT